MKKNDNTSPYQFYTDQFASFLDQYFETHTNNDIEIKHLHRLILKPLEEKLIIRTLEHTGGNKVKAAEILGIHRNSIHKKLTDKKT